MKKGVLIQTVIALVASSGGFLSGTAVAWPECVEQQVVKFHFHLTESQFYWSTMIVRIGAIIGCVFGGILIELLGRKLTILVTNGPYTAGYILLLLSRNFQMLFWGRLLIGMTLGGLSVAVPIYVREISEKDIRGALGTLYYLFYCFGFLFVALMGFLCPVYVLNMILTIFPVLCNIPLIFMPESPVFLFAKGHENKAKVSLGLLRSERDMNQHMTEMKDELQAAGGHRRSFDRNPFKDKIGFRSFIIVASMMSFSEFSGMAVIWRCGKKLVAMVDHTYNSQVVLIITGAIMFGTVPFATFTVDRIGRRILLFASSIGSAASLLLLGCFLILHDFEPDTMIFLSPVLICLLVMCVTTANIGICPVAWVLLGEMFTIEIKALTVTISAMLYWIFSFLVLVLSNLLAKAVGLGWGVVFIILGALMILVTIFVSFCVVETKHTLCGELSSVLTGGSGMSSRYNDLITIKSPE